MVPVSSKETAKKELDLYNTVLSFLKKIRKNGKTTSKEWSEYRSQINGIGLNEDLRKAADLWTMDNLDQFAPDNDQLPPLNDVDFMANISPRFASQLMEALYYGMLNPTQANMISDEIQDADPDAVSTVSLEELLVKIWIGNANSYKKMIVN
ncbi:MAG: hypothetical protein HUK20_01600 [Fibrobacter sp.]|nr:hypothetical protein [Fibrobacter sp.]